MLSISGKLKEDLKKAHDNRAYFEQAKIYLEIAGLYRVTLDQGDNAIHPMVRAIAVYNFALGAYQKYINSGTDSVTTFLTKLSNIGDLKSSIIQGIIAAEQQFLHSIGIYSYNRYHYLSTCRAHKDYMVEFRQAIREKLKQGVSSKKLDQSCYFFVKKFIRLLVKECLAILGLPPCDYAIIGLGSLARREATPYSDFEFAILLEEGKDTESNKQYFRNLTRLLNIKVLNLTETSPKIEYIKELEFTFDYDKNPVQKGFAFDSKDPSGCKTPLGNQHILNLTEGEKFELIKTPQKMAEYQSQDWFEKCRTLPTILSNVCLITGNANLMSIYKQRVASKLDMPPISDNDPSSRQLTVPEYQREFPNGSYTQYLQKQKWITSSPSLRQERATNVLLTDALKFEPKAGKKNEQGRVYPVKYDLYRLVNLLFDGLALYFDLSAPDTRGRIKELAKYDFISISAAETIQNCFDNITKIRLNNYLLNKQQSDEMVANQSQEEQLFKIYQKLIILLDCAYEFAANGNFDLFRKYNFKLDNSLAKLRVYEKLFRHDKVIKEGNSLLLIHKDNPENYATVLNLVGRAYMHKKQYELAKIHYKKAIETAHPSLYVDYARLLDEMGLYQEALAILDKAEKTDYDQSKWIHGEYEKQLLLSRIYACQGSILLKTGANYAGAQMCFEKVNDIRNANNNLVKYGLADCKDDLVTLFTELGQYDKAFKLIDKLIDDIKKEFGTYHPYVAKALNRKGQIFYQQTDYEQSIACNQKAIEIYQAEPYNSYQDEMATCLNSIGIAELELNKYFSALDNVKKALALIEHVHGKQHKSAAIYRINIGAIQVGMGNFATALEEFEIAKKILIELGDKERLAECLHNISNTYCKLAKLMKCKKTISFALKQELKALSITNKLYRDTQCPKYLKTMVSYLNHLSTIYILKSHNKEAENCCHLADNLLDLFCKNISHPLQAITYGKIAEFYSSKANAKPSDRRIALAYLGKKLQKLKTFDQDILNDSLAETYAKIAQVLYDLKEYVEAYRYLQKSDKITQRIGNKLTTYLKKREAQDKIYKNHAIQKRIFLNINKPIKILINAIDNNKDIKLIKYKIKKAEPEYNRLVDILFFKHNQDIGKIIADIDTLLKEELDKVELKKPEKSKKQLYVSPNFSKESSASKSKELTGTYCPIKKISYSLTGLFRGHRSDEKVKNLSMQNIPLTMQLGSTLDKGGCFFDAVAQSLSYQSKTSYTAKDLRKNCHQYIIELDEGLKEANWIYQRFLSDANKLNPNDNGEAILEAARKYQHYMANIRFTAAEIDTGAGLNTDTAICSELDIDGRILSEKLGTKLHVIMFHKVEETLIEEHQLNGKSIANADVNYAGQDTVYIAVFNNHFVPLLPQLPNLLTDGSHIEENEGIHKRNSS